MCEPIRIGDVERGADVVGVGPRARVPRGIGWEVPAGP